MPNYNIGNNPNENSPSQGLFTDGGLPVVQEGTGKCLAGRIRRAPNEERTPENQPYFKPDMDIYNKNPAFRREAHDALIALLKKQGIPMPEGELSDVDLGLALNAFDAAYLGWIAL